MGQGLNTKVAQVTATELGGALACVRVTATDTSKVANTSATAASTGSDLNGKVAQDAAARIRRRLAEFAAGRWGGAVDEVVFANNAVAVNGHHLPFAQVVDAAYWSQVQLWSEGFYATPGRSEEHTSELQSLMRISYAVFCLKKNNTVNFTIRAQTNTKLAA